MDKKKAICEYLRKNHIGKENAIHSKELEKLFLLDGRNIRRKISALRQDGFPICSDETGYYYADNQKEINTTVYRPTPEPGFYLHRSSERMRRPLRSRSK